MIFVLLVLLGLAFGVRLPDGLPLCHRSDPKFSDCVGDSITQGLRIFAPGYKPMGVPVLEPFFVEKMEINEAPTKAVAVVQIYRNFFVHGVTRSNISNMRFDIDKGCGWTMDVFSPQMNLVGDLELQGNILMFPLKSRGECNMTLTNFVHHHTMRCEKFSKNGKTYLKFSNYSIDARPEYVHYQFTDLFPSNREVEKVMKKTINDNALLLFNDVKGGFEHAFSIFHQKIANLIFTKLFSTGGRKMKNLLEKITPEDYFTFHMTCLKLMGIYPPKKRIPNLIYLVVAVPHLFLTCAPVILESIDVIIADEEYERKILTIGMLSLHIEAAVRIITWFRMRKGIEEVISIIRRNTFSFEIFEESHSQHITRVSVPTYQKYVTSRTSLFCSLWYASYMLYVIFNISSSYTINFFQDVREEFNPRVNRTSMYKDFVYPMWLPFDASVSDGYYLIAFFYQPYAFWFLMGGYMTLDCLYLNIVTQLRSQVTIISYALSHVDGDRLPGTENDFKQEEIRLVKCIQELQVIYRTARKLEDLLNPIFFIHFGLGVFALCCLSYTASTAGSFSSPHLMMMSSVMFVEFFITCLLCYSFTSEFSNTLRAMYELDWLRYPQKLRKMIIFTMARLQKPPFFTLANWTNIDMLLFFNLLKLVYSFYMLISKVNK